MIVSVAQALTFGSAFDQYVFIDADQSKIDMLKRATGARPDARFLVGAPEEVLSKQIVPRIRKRDRRHALLLLDTYSGPLDWEMLRSAGEARTFDVVVSFSEPDLDASPSDRYQMISDFEGILRRESGFPHITAAHAVEREDGAELYYLFFATHDEALAEAMAEAMSSIPVR